LHQRKGILMKISEQWTQKPTNQLILGNFMEAGIGRQLPGMWSEMIYNRAFRDVEPIKHPTWEWVGLDKEHYNENAPFWHSGYEEYDWEPLGTPVRTHSCGNYTFKGSTSLLIQNAAEGKPCGLKQKGLHLHNGRQYIFQIFAGDRGEQFPAGLNGFGEVIHTLETKDLIVKIGHLEKTFPITTECQQFTWEFQWNDTEPMPKEGYEIQIYITYEGSFVLAYCSLMPADNLKGWRREVVEKMKEVGPSVVRFPGGCFTSFFNWESSIGDRNTREPQTSFYWGGLEENDVGLDEFMSLSEMVGFEPQICFNMMTSTPFKARQMVEYLNAPETVGMGRSRYLNGHKEPYKVRLFEMDNEPCRKWTYKQYAEQCVAFAREMRLADPSIEFMMAAYTYYPSDLPQMLEIAGKDINYVIYREGSPEFVHQILPMIHAYNEKNNTNIRLVNTEWIAPCHSIEPFENPNVPMNFSWCGEISNDYDNIFSRYEVSWNYALNCAHRILDYVSYGGDFALANFNNMCNTWGQNVIEGTKDTCYLSCSGHIFAFFKRVYSSCTAAPVDVETDGVFALAAKPTDRDVTQLYIINHTGSKQILSLPEGNWTYVDGLKGVSRLAKESEHGHAVLPYRQDPAQNTIAMEALSIICLEQ